MRGKYILGDEAEGKHTDGLTLSALKDVLAIKS